jgi:UDP-N-acetylglucosamine 2-epimerase (non-hydrolysing)
MKIAPLMREMGQYPDLFEQILVHTGQHYDPQMSQVFFNELELPQPDINLNVGSGSHAWQTAQVILRFEPVVLEARPDWVVVVGDVNSTLACSLVCSKLGIRVAHVEAGLRSFDRSMPEEINRILTDQISDLLFTPSQDGNENLLHEGIAPESIHFVGNVMIDTLVNLLPKAEARWDKLKDNYNIDHKGFVLVTLHRPSNVDDPNILSQIMAAMVEISQDLPVLFPVHPRTRQRINDLKIDTNSSQLHTVEPLGYLDFLAIQANAALVLTDSGGIQEETTYLGIPCLTARSNTERPVTITHGTNQLVNSDTGSLISAMQKRLMEKPLDLKVPPLWDGHAAERIVGIMKGLSSGQPRL